MHIYPPGIRIAGRYEVAGRPLLGGMGIVYLCMDHVEDRPVALKTFRPEYLPDRSARDRFLREGSTWVDLGQHPHIVRCYRVERIGDGREVYLVLEMVAKAEGRQDASLRSWLILGQPLPVEQALLFALQIVQGMKHAREHIPGFVHRDLKPENVIVGADQLSSLEINRLRVTDFGLSNVLSVARVTTQVSKESEASENLSRTQLTHGVIGTPQYMAPEQWQVGELGVWTDVYALGCILVEMLTGQFAVSGNSQQALRKAHCDGQVRALPTSLPGAVRDLVSRCLQLRAGDRYGDWGEIETILEGIWEQISGQRLPTTKMTQPLESEERIAVGWSYNNIGFSYMDLGKADVARYYFEQARAVGETEGEFSLESAGLNHLGLAYTRLGDPHRAIVYHEQALEIRREIGDLSGKGNALGNLGIAYDNLGEARRAIDYYEQQLEITREIGDRRGEGDILGNLGIAYQNMGDAQQAISFFEQCLNIHREIEDRRGQGADLGNLGNTYADLGDARRAIGFYEQALKISREIGDRLEEGSALGNLGLTYSDLGDTRRAINYFEQALVIRREIEDVMGVAKDSLSMAYAYAQEGEPKKALPLAQEAARIWEQIGHRRNVQLAQDFIAELQGGKEDSSDMEIIQDAAEAFLRAGSLTKMQAAISQYPFMTDDQFIAFFEHYITENVGPEERHAFQQRMDWLRQIKEEQEQAS